MSNYPILVKRANDNLEATLWVLEKTQKDLQELIPELREMLEDWERLDYTVSRNKFYQQAQKLLEIANSRIYQQAQKMLEMTNQKEVKCV